MTNMILTVIGGGSPNWMRMLMRDIYLLDEVDGGEIRLVDPNTEYAQAVKGMLQMFNKLRCKDYKISVVDNRKEALDNADFVITTFSPGTMDAFYNDLEIPIKYGIRLPCSMTVGPGGISASLRTASVAYEIVKDMEEVCPKAWLLNVTNPMSVVTRAMNMASTNVRVIGLCHELHHLPQTLGPILGMEKPKEVTVLDYLYSWLADKGFEYTVAGLNHFIWLTEAKLNGQNLIPEIQKFSKDNCSILLEDMKYGPANPFASQHSVKLALCRTFGYLPIPGDRHLVEFWPSLCNITNGFGMKYGVYKTSVDYRVNTLTKNLEYIHKVAAGQEKIDWKKSDEEMCQIMSAIIGNKTTTAIVNIPNRGQIENLPHDVVVETFATITSDGVEPKSSGLLPGPVGTLCRLHADVNELTVNASLNGDRKSLLQALSLDPLSASCDFSEISKLADELIMANRKWLPRFFE